MSAESVNQPAEIGLKRYDIQITGHVWDDDATHRRNFSWQDGVMRETAAGEWVRYDEVRAEIEALEARVPAIQFARLMVKIEELSKGIDRANGIQPRGSGPR